MNFINIFNSRNIQNSTLTDFRSPEISHLTSQYVVGFDKCGTQPKSFTGDLSRTGAEMRFIFHVPRLSLMALSQGMSVEFFSTMCCLENNISKNALIVTWSPQTVEYRTKTHIL